jgi:glycerol-3-phosphate dehydrogenase
MNRTATILQLNTTSIWDIVIIGGGATGLGAAVDAANRGFKVLLVEQDDFAKGTSSRSTKLVHGGVRYLQQGNIKLIKEALKERKLLLQNAPHVCSSLQFVIPVYTWFNKWYYGIGLKLYDFISGKHSLGKTTVVNTATVKKLLPTINTKKLCGGIVYFDGQFDDARLAINLAQTASDKGAAVLNYFTATNFNTEKNIVKSVVVKDEISNLTYTVKAKIFINATGVFTDALLYKINKQHLPIVKASQGVHIVIDKKYLPTDKALMIPTTTDGRVLFAVPWHNKIVVGTTDTPVENILLEPVALQQEIDFIITTFNNYIQPKIAQLQVLSVFAGLRPLVHVQSIKNTALLSREHTIINDKNGIITITGGKWTTYRIMAQEVIDIAIKTAALTFVPSSTIQLPIHGKPIAKIDGVLAVYGSNAAAINLLIQNEPNLSMFIHPNYLFTYAQVVYAVRVEMALTVMDFLARRIRLLFLDATAAKAAAPTVAKIMANELNENDGWIQQQIEQFNSIANHYLL